MQAGESGNSNQSDDGITFRPSPNFKHMKKYLKSKFEEDQNEEIRLSNTVVQPPLPPNSPPPDCPITLKQEVEDDGYECAASAGRSPSAEPSAEPSAADAAPDGMDASAGPGDFTMCKDWVRGTCTRGAACIYVHKLDKSQLRGVYRFCRDFANSRCERQVCYFVHATTFEKEHYYRTAYLPPHATQHLKPPPAQPAQPAQPAAVPPVAGPAPEVAVAVPPEIPSMFSHPPPPSLPSSPAVPLGTVALRPMAPVAPRPMGPAALGGPGVGAVRGAGGAAEPGQGALAAGIFKREWRELEDCGVAAREPVEGEPPARRCAKCEIMDIRLQTTKTQVDIARRNMKRLDAQFEELLKNCNHLQGVLRSLLRPRRGVKGNRLPKFCEDDNTDVLLAQMRMLLTKVVFGAEPDERDGERKAGREP